MDQVEHVKVILNPYGGRWPKPEKMARVSRALVAAGLNYDLVLTEAPGHAVELARQAAIEAWPVVVAVGGDGTVNEVVNGLLAEPGPADTARLGIIPLGTANDLADMLALPRSLEAACQRLAAGQTRLLDVGQVNGRYFVNNSAIGLEPLVSLAHEEIRWLRGNIRYIAAALKAIAQAKYWQFQLTWDGGEITAPMTIVSVGNSPRTGGAFYMTPQAKLDDGLLDFIYGMKLSRGQMLALLPKTFKGQHIHHPLVSYHQTTALTIVASPGTPIQADGEIIALDATEINYRIIPAKLAVIV